MSHLGRLQDFLADQHAQMHRGQQHHNNEHDRQRHDRELLDSRDQRFHQMLSAGRCGPPFLPVTYVLARLYVAA
jgi:hypothetical protein